MAFLQRIHPAGDDRCQAAMGHAPDGCTVIDCVTDEDITHHETGAVIHPAGTVVWHSHAPADLDQVARLNTDHPHEDRRRADPKP